MQTWIQPHRNLPLLALACLLSACSGGASGPAEPPPSEFERRFTVSVTLRYVEVSGREACDGVALITGNPRDGEFQYRAEVVSAGRVYGSTQSTDYGSYFGQHFSRLPGELINFTNRDVTVGSLVPGDRVYINFYGIEWDGTNMDGDMDNPHASGIVLITDDYVVGTLRDMKLLLPQGGQSLCELTLVWDLSVTSRMVPVP